MATKTERKAIRGTNDPDVSARFWARVTKTDGCWVWSAKTRGNSGSVYGVFTQSPGDVVAAHRWSYTAAKGAIPEELVIDHLCRNTLCVNPDHLEAVTVRENTVRGFPSGKQSWTECPNGHPYTAESTYEARGRRECIRCRREAVRRYKARKRAAVRMARVGSAA